MCVCGRGVWGLLLHVVHGVIMCGCLVVGEKLACLYMFGKSTCRVGFPCPL